MKACLLIFSIVSVSALFFFGCKKNEEVDFHTDYYPVKKGKYIIYQVQDIVIDQGVDQYDTTNVFIKAIIGDTFIDNEGRVANRYERWFGPTASGPWTLVDIWTTIVANNRAELVEENHRKIKLVFAPTEYKTWNANAYNTLNDQDCYYSDLHVPFSIGGYDFDSTVTVLQDYTTPNLIEYRNQYERYAKGVGMIQKVYVDETHHNFDTLQVEKARKLYMNLVSYGEE